MSNSNEPRSPGFSRGSVTKLIILAVAFLGVIALGAYYFLGRSSNAPSQLAGADTQGLQAPQQQIPDFSQDAVTPNPQGTQAGSPPPNIQMGEVSENGSITGQVPPSFDNPGPQGQQVNPGTIQEKQYLAIPNANGQNPTGEEDPLADLGLPTSQAQAEAMPTPEVVETPNPNPTETIYESPADQNVVPEEEYAPQENNVNTVATIDPRKLAEKDPSVQRTWEELSEQEKTTIKLEPTNLSVQRTIGVVLPNGETKTIRLKIPVLYESRLLRINGTNKKKATEILEKMKDLRDRLAKIKTDSEAILKEWNELVTESTPEVLLLPESPTLPQNQSASELNRPEESTFLELGQDIQYEVQ